MKDNYKFGITGEFPCNYLPEQKERLLIALDDRLNNAESYQWLMENGFRRSGDQVYRPHCLNCNACQSIRVVVDEFKKSRSQARLAKKFSHFRVKISRQKADNYYPLYERYINQLHNDGSMYPANFQQYEDFLTCTITNQIFVELWDEDKLISVAVTDDLPNALSAVYTFYDPDYRKAGLGILSILKQIELSKKLGKEFLYLGYQIDDCQKMNYKSRFHQHQILITNMWDTVNK